MREITFRAYDTEDNRMHYSNDKEVIFTIENLGVSLYLDDGTEIVYFKLMQYTGIKDMNGKEIYEGDIVKCINNYNNIVFTGVVDFNDCSFRIKEDGITHYCWMDYSIEVLGNIYENPELLEGEKNE